MHNVPISLKDRLRTWSWAWPWAPALALVILVGAIAVYWGPHEERLERAECMRLYHAAHNMGETLAVDAQVPFNQVGKGGLNCGGRRRLGVLH